MARRRLNTTVFAVIMGVLLVGGITVFGVLKLRGGGDPKELERRGDELFAKGEFKQAYEDYNSAINAAPRDPALRVKLGDTAIKLTRDDTGFFNIAMGQWTQAVAIDGKYKPALERLISSDWERVDLGLGTGAQMAGTFSQIREHADQLAAADPNSTQAPIWHNIATVRQSLVSDSIPPEQLEQSIQALRDLSERDPANSDAPLYIAQARIRAAQNFLVDKRDDKASAAFDDAAATMDKALARGQGKNAQLQFNAHEIYTRLSSLDPRAPTMNYRDRMDKTITAAAAAVTEQTPKADVILLRWADWQWVANKPEEGRKIRQKFYEAHPDNQMARLAWAKTLSATKADRPKAVEILSKDIPLPNDVVGIGVLRHYEYEARTLNELILMRLGDAALETDAVKKAAILKLADQSLDKLKTIFPGKSPLVMGLEGRTFLAKGQTVDAVRSMADAYHAFSPDAKDYELMFLLATVYSRDQPGSAKTLCEEILHDNVQNYLPVRDLLARLLIQENKFEAAKAQIDVIRTQDKNYPTLAKLDGLLSGATTAAASGGEARRALPETTNPERWVKWSFAHEVSDQQEQTRLLNSIIDNDAKDVRAVALLVQLYKEQDLNDSASRIAETAYKANPDDPTIKLIKSELSGMSAKGLREQIIAQIKATTTDPYQLQAKLYEVEKLPGGSWEAGIAALIEMERLKPGETAVEDRLFKEYLGHQQYDAAKVYLDKLVKQNVDQVGGRLYRHRFATAKSDYPEAEKIGLDLVERYPELAASWLALGHAQEALGKWKDAVDSYTQVLSRQPTNYDAMRALVDTYYYSGRTDDAEAKLRDMRAFYPNDPTVRELLLTHWANFGKPELALVDRQELLRKNPKEAWNFLALAATFFKNAQKLAAESKLDESKKNIDAAFAVLTRGGEQFPDDPRFYAQVAEIQQYNGKSDEAEAFLLKFADRELAKKPPAVIRPDPWFALSDFYRRGHQFGKMVTSMQQALVRSDNNLNVRLRLVNAQVQAKQFKEAIHTLDEVRDVPDPRIRRQRIDIMVGQGDLAGAEKEIREELTHQKEMKPQDLADLLALLGSVLIDTNRADQAFPELDRALAQDPRNETAKYLRAMAFIKKIPADPLAAINELVVLKKSSQKYAAQVRLLLAQEYEATGKRPQAILELDEGLQQNGGSREMRLALIELYRRDRPPRFQLAFDLVQKAENDPVLKTDPVWPREAAHLFRDVRLYQQAVMKMNLACQLAPGDIDYRRELVEMLIQFHDFGGALLQTDKLLREGTDQWWVRLDRGVATGRQVTKEMLASTASDPAAMANVKTLQSQALAEFDLAIKIAGNNVPQISFILRSMGECVGYEPALARVAPHLADDPNNDWKLLSIAMKRAKGDFPGAIADSLRMLDDPANGSDKPLRRVPILRALADAYQYSPTPDYPKSVERYKQMLALDGTDLLTLNNLAYLISEVLQPPDPQGARAYSQIAYDITRQANDPNTRIMDTHAWILVLCGGPEQRLGMQVLQSIVLKDPNFVEGRYHYAESLLRLNPPQPAEAEKQLKEALRLYDEEVKLVGSGDGRLRDQIQTSLGKATAAVKNQ